MEKRIPYTRKDGVVRMVLPSTLERLSKNKPNPTDEEVEMASVCAPSAGAKPFGNDYASYHSRYSYSSSPSGVSFIENCRNCGAPPEPVCQYCGTIHDGKTYKQRNLPPPPPMTEAEKKFWLGAQMGIQLTQPSSPFILYDP